jgi:hypothetical protein
MPVTVNNLSEDLPIALLYINELLTDKRLPIMSYLTLSLALTIPTLCPSRASWHSFGGQLHQEVRGSTACSHWQRRVQQPLPHWRIPTIDRPHHPQARNSKRCAYNIEMVITKNLAIQFPGTLKQAKFQRRKTSRCFQPINGLAALAASTKPDIQSTCYSSVRKCKAIATLAQHNDIKSIHDVGFI